MLVVSSLLIAFGNPPWQWQIAEKHGQTFVVLMDKTHQRNMVTPKKILISEWTLPRHDILRVQLAKFLHGPSDKTHTADTSICTPAAEDTEEMRIRPFHSVWNLCYSSRSWIVSMTTRSSTAVRKSRSGSQEVARKPPWSRVCAWATKCPICV